MSLEKQLEALTAKVDVLNGLITKIIEGYVPDAAVSKTERTDKPAEKPAEAKAEKAEPAAKEKPTGSDWTEAALKKVLVALVNAHGRVAMENLLTQFGAAKFSELPADKYDKVGAAVQAKLKE